MADFPSRQKLLIRMEGHRLWSCSAHDLGGETYDGITKKDHPTWSGFPILDAAKLRPNFPKCITEEEFQKLDALVDEYYFKAWWCGILMCDKIEDDRLALELYEMSVNCGPYYGIKTIQRALNVCNKNQERWPDLIIDGRMGLATVKIANIAMKSNPGYVPLNVLTAFNSLQAARYIEIAEGNKDQEYNIDGWFNMRIRNVNYSS
jgi:lysozyme family protein